MLISIIVPAYNAAHTLAPCLAALEKQTIPRDQYEVIVVDDGSTDNTAALAARPGIHLIRCRQNRGAAAARNRGLEAARGDIVCFTDADCEPAPDWLEELTRPLRHNPAIMGTKGVYTTRQRHLVARFVQIEYEDKYEGMAGQARIDFIDTYSAAYRRQLFTDFGGFDETIFYVEDQEFSFRLAAHGCWLAFQPTAVVAHRHSQSLRAYGRKKYWIGYWKARFIRRYPERLAKDSHTPQVLKLQMGLAALMLAAAVGALLLPLLGWVMGGVTAVFFLTTLPFCRKAWPKDRAVALVAPFLLFIRAFALGFGFACGSI